MQARCPENERSPSLWVERSRFCGDRCTSGITSNTFRVVSGYGNAIETMGVVSSNS
ncbi:MULTISPECIES: hypothetical protein [Limnospira]|uniref:hypothetical protein n=1 Tax=Limnospira TaxID=2596745 RepID=UPI000322128B|nr:hypothetical protein [Limnospira indica]